eukprot:TRINITY_DN57308_c0_g1_i1.p1 TRINITY_DN57308_c0_g1~~TRINITY_DN57308_c0_g1_i1.p1  ORF type:complete len:331 (-),score=112.08 TRINITY_DN57308_c0_g1_i1:328-1320(-)
MAAAVRRDGATWRVTLPSSTGGASRSAPDGSGGAVARDPLAVAIARREEGLQHWRAGRFAEAVASWEAAVEKIREETGKAPLGRLQEQLLPLRANLAQGRLKLERFEAAKEHAKAAMVLAEKVDAWLRAQPACEDDGPELRSCRESRQKARFRLAEAHGGLGEWSEAEEVLAALAQEAEESGAAEALAAVTQGRARLEARRRAAARAERGRAQRMLGALASRTSAAADGSKARRYERGDRVKFRGIPGVIEEGPDSDGDYIVQCDNGERFPYASGYELTTEAEEEQARLAAERQRLEAESRREAAEKRRCEAETRKAKLAADRRELESMD